MDDVFCTHEQTTAPDQDGFVICVDCGRPVQRPLTLDEINDQIRTDY